MKQLLFATLFCFASLTLLSQNTVTDTITVYGNCEMCKAKIENSLKKKDGITYRNWNVPTKQLIVRYDPTQITLDEIQQKVAATGYDTEKFRAEDKVYKKLHHCCQYERPGE